MLGIFLTGLIAGIASALLFATVVASSPLTLVLFYAAPLPLMIAGLGWSHRSALTGALAGAVAIGLAVSPAAALVFAVSVGAPAFCLSYLALLGRRENDVVVEWYPAGSIVAAAALLAGALGVGGVLALGPGYDQFFATMQGGVELMLRSQMGLTSGQPLVLPDVADPAAFVALLAALIPPVVVMFYVFTSLLNLWLAGRIVERSGKLPRPWPPFASLTLPNWAGAAFVASGFASMAPDMIGLIAEIFAAGLLMAFVLVGFAVMHALTTGLSARALILGGLYLATVAMGWPIFAAAVLGLIEQFLRLRARLDARRNRLTPKQ